MPAYNIVNPASMQAGQPEDISQVLANFQALATLLNGQLDQYNISTAAALVVASIDAGSHLYGGVRQPKVITSSFSGGPPGAPSDQDIWIATGVAGSSTVSNWMFRYNAGSGSAYKWEFLGGFPVEIGPVGGSTATTTTGYLDWGAGANWTAPRAGDYRALFGITPSVSAFTATFFGQAQLLFGATPSGAIIQHGGPLQWAEASESTKYIFTGVSAADVLKPQVQNDRVGGGTITWTLPWLEIIPVRVS